MDKHTNDVDMVRPGLSLPDDIIVFEILSRLPVKSLLKFKCVCKTWCSTMKDSVFINKHLEHSPIIWLYENDENFSPVMQCNGLILERHNSNYTYRLRNPATKQILDLPDSILETATTGVPKHLCYIPSTNEIKVVYVQSLAQGNKEVLIYNVLILGKDFTWKGMVSPLLGDLEHTMQSVWSANQGIGTKFYYTRLASDLYVDCLDLKNYSITNIKTPLRGKDAFIVNWEGKLSIAYIEQQQLNVHVLEDYKSHKWSESEIVIPLTFLRDCHDSKISVEDIVPYIVQGNLVYWAFYYSFFSFSFNIQSKEVKYLTPFFTEAVLLYTPSLMPLHSKVKPRTQESLLSKFCLCRA